MVKHHSISNRAVHTFMALIAILLLSSIAHGGGLLFVDDDAPPGGNGKSWDAAYRFLADALAFACDPKNGITEVRVGQGVYQPDRDEANPTGTCDPGPCDREATFQLCNAVALMGGYAGIGAKNPDARDIELFETILSGDLLGNDGPDFENNEENSFHVVRGDAIDETAVLDGFTIAAGNADGSGDQRGGAGMYNSSGASPTVISCTFVANSADFGGGGMYNLQDSSPTVIDCTFNGNLAGSPGAAGSPPENATNPAGGGMYNSVNSSPTVIGCTFLVNAASYGGGMSNAGNSSPTVIGCTFSDNSGGDGGGMLNISDSNPAVTDCIFSGNSAYYRGGGMYNFAYSNPTVANCTFSENSAGTWGGGMYNLANSNPTVANCTFSENSADGGGGMFNWFSSNPTVTNCTFSGNSAEASGGMFNFYLSNPAILNCLFTANSADEGGGIYNYQSSPALSNCTMSNNLATTGGAMFSFGTNSVPSNATLRNCVVYFNSADSIFDDPDSTTTISYSDVEGGWEGDGNIDVDPMFVAPGSGDYRLSSGSPCLDAGHNWGVPVDVNDYDEDGVTNELFPVDLDGNPRFNADKNDFDPGCGVPVVLDMGAYEYQFDPVEDVIFADLTGDGSVGVADLLGLLGDWGPCAKGCCLADLDLWTAPSAWPIFSFCWPIGDRGKKASRHRGIEALREGGRRRRDGRGRCASPAKLWAW